MRKYLILLSSLLCLLLLSACGQEETGTWYPRAGYVFSWEEVLNADMSPFDTSVIHDPDHDYTHRGWLDENTALFTRSNAGSFSCYEMAAVTLEGQVTVLEADVHPHAMITAQDGVVIFGSYYETILDDVVTFARWNGDETLTVIHTFEEGIALSFQQFFSPDGTKAVMSWTPEVPSSHWKVRIIDLKTGDYQDVTPPGLESEEPILLISRWQDDRTLHIGATDMLPDGYCAGWEYALP